MNMNPTAIQPFKGRGRGRVLEKVPMPLRRPGEFEIKPVPDHINQIETLLSELAQEPKDEKTLYALVGKIKINCDNKEDLPVLLDMIYKFSLRNKETAEAAAILCNLIGDFEVSGVKFRTILLRKVQVDYNEREKNFAEIEKFIQKVRLLCNLFHHLRLPNDSRILVLISPMVEYLEMLLKDGNDSTVDVFIELAEKHCSEIQEYQPNLYNELLHKIRLEIIYSPFMSVRKPLLDLLVQILRREILFSNNNYEHSIERA